MVRTIFKAARKLSMKAPLSWFARALTDTARSMDSYYNGFR